MSDTWGKGSVNNNIGWGQAAGSATNNWGKSQKESWAGQTDIVGVASVSITYSSSAFCSDASDPTPTISNNAGAGTFSSTAGLVFISTTTGEVDLDASTAGATYLITYTDTDAATATFSLTINDLDNAAFAYSASSYEPTDADPTPTITGLTGGTFSGTTGLVINSTTGEIDLSASTVASHTITYDTTSSGSSVCPNTSTQNVDIALAGIANNYSMSFDGSSGEGVIVNNFTELNGVNEFSVSAWVKAASGPQADNYAVILQNDQTYVQFGISQNSTANQLNFLIRNSGNSGYGILAGPTNFFNGSWRHIVCTYDGSTMKFYVDNGTPLTNSYSTTLPTYSNPTLRIGRGNSIYPNLFNGQIDEVGIWDTALTSTQVSEIYNATSANLTKDLSTIEPSNLKYWNRLGD